MDWEKLKAEFPDEDLGWRVMYSGLKDGKPWAQIAPYVDSRAIQDRLDEVVGPENWTDEYRDSNVATGSGFICTLSIKVDDVWIPKSDGAGLDRNTETFKSGISDALKRAAVKWGIGRYLYSLPMQWANSITNKRTNAPGEISVIVKEKGSDKKQHFYTVPPKIYGVTDNQQDLADRELLIAECSDLENYFKLSLKQKMAARKKNLGIEDFTGVSYDKLKTYRDTMLAKKEAA